MDDLMKSSQGNMFDADGFFLVPGLWSETLANRIAQADGMEELSSVQLDLLHTLRNEYKKNGAVTAFSHICHLRGQGPNCLQHLFPGPREAWRIAGLPNPGEEAKAYM